MVQYTCFRCGYLTNQKNHMITHLNRKNVCEPILRDIELNEYSKDILGRRKFIETVENPDFAPFCSTDAPFCSTDAPFCSIFCEHCKKSYKYKRNLSKHLKTCKVKITNDEEELKKILEEEESLVRMLNERIEAYKSEIDTLKSSMVVNNNNNNTQNNTQNNTNNTQNNVNINIKRLAYDKTNYDIITPEQMQWIIRTSLNCIPNIVALTHFNANHPENHNIYIGSWKSGNVIIYNGTKWVIHNWNAFSERVIGNNIDTISDWIYLNGDEYPQLVEKFNNFINNYDNNVKFLKELCNNTKLVFYNNRDKLMSSRTKVKNIPNNLRIES